MSILMHHCLSTGTSRFGSALDCGACWEALELSVELAQSEGTYAPDAEPEPENSTEHSENSTESECSLDHDTTADVLPSEDEAGGYWRVDCICGWSESGQYARDTGEAVAFRLARLKGRAHEKSFDQKEEL